ncbi:TetR/AcrR family transcriptional regulator [Pseudomonas sp. 681]|uniref:TetR/AcrR family transcriptional regulator n=1 Tax=Pseudomonas fungipugnans TaxID=3024217 RepID=A0ABT6QFZ8_9PSED|nr:TetR/AcrR family transcriptional regulator [Pseudomonas sp. 681]MDI2589818.1 TetR/AcrR family transcriptional regulator [Pseudomonas sp. 681]MDI2592720.1 TetR/AcrR family transcriptional regulator [Pseudomonas sp. 681]MDI2592727.1 TetR/AcrR family transcriptional regulator [Pseudomonas sp. 681]MDI2595570.1 TetR/AcrR family transcriptional regulator [Pseudomonas sp. 681]
MTTTRDLLLKSLAELTAKGPSHISITALSKIAKISRSSIYKYYPDIVIKVRGGASEFSLSNIEKISLKLYILKKQLKEQRVLVGMLTNVCSEQLVEIIELNAKYLDALESKNLQITFLESALAKSKKVVLKTVK